MLGHTWTWMWCLQRVQACDILISKMCSQGLFNPKTPEFTSDLSAGLKFLLVCISGAMPGNTGRPCACDHSVQSAVIYGLFVSWDGSVAFDTQEQSCHLCSFPELALCSICFGKCSCCISEINSFSPWLSDTKTRLVFPAWQRISCMVNSGCIAYVFSCKSFSKCVSQQRKTFKLNIWILFWETAWLEMTPALFNFCIITIVH